MKDFLEPLLWLVLILCLFLSWIFYAKACRAERLLMIEKGIDPNEVMKKANGFKVSWVKLGVLIFGLSLGLGVAILLTELDLVQNLGEPHLLATLGIFGGAAMIIAHYIDKKRQ